MVSLVLTTPTSDARATPTAAAFEQALRTLHLLSPEETARVAASTPRSAPPDDAVPADSSALADGAVLDAGVMFESAPAPKIDPIGPCPSGTP